MGDLLFQYSDTDLVGQATGVGDLGTDWEITAAAISPGNSLSVEQVNQGSDTYRKISHVLQPAATATDPSYVTVRYRYKQPFDPQSSPKSLKSLDVSWRGLVLSGPAVGEAIVLYQQDLSTDQIKEYTVLLDPFKATEWTKTERLGLHAQDFEKNGEVPDFTSGGPIWLGYVRSNTTYSTSSGTTVVHAIDDFTVVFHADCST